MPRLTVPNSVTLHNARAFLSSNRPFAGRGRMATLQLHPRWAHLDPMALSMIAAWGAWCRRNGFSVAVKHLGRQAHYAARMKLFQHLGVNFDPHIAAREEAGRALGLYRQGELEKLLLLPAEAKVCVEREPGLSTR